MDLWKEIAESWLIPFAGIILIIIGGIAIPILLSWLEKQKILPPHVHLVKVPFWAIMSGLLCIVIWLLMLIGIWSFGAFKYL